MGLFARIGLTRRPPPPPALAVAAGAPPLAARAHTPPDVEPSPARPEAHEIDLPDLPPVLAEIAALRQTRPRVMRREVFAAELVAYLRREGFTGYHLADDIDEVARWLFDRHGIQPLPLDMVREAIAALPGVTHERLRLKSRPELAHVAYRLKCKGSTNERPWLYRVSDTEPEALPMSATEPPLGRGEAAAAPPPDRADRAVSRSAHRAAARADNRPEGGQRRKHRTIADVRAGADGRDADDGAVWQRKVA